jgi:hypothetical protein
LEVPVSFDYKSLQATIAERPPATDRYCPECGQPLAPPAAVAGASPSSGPWWSWAVIAVGVSLVVAALLRAWIDNQHVAFARAYLSDPDLAALDAQSGGSVIRLLGETRGQVSRDLLVGAGGVVLVGLGLGSGARRRLLPGFSTHNSISESLLGLWGAGEMLGGAMAGLVLLTFGSLVASELAGGQPLALGVLASAAGRTFDALVVVVRVVPGG